MVVMGGFRFSKDLESKLRLKSLFSSRICGRMRDARNMKTMGKRMDATVKENVSRFNSDVSSQGSYSYTTEALSARYANGRLSEAIASAFGYEGKRVLDLGCGDGAYTVEFNAYQPTEVLGVDPADLAVRAAQRRANHLGVGDVVKFRTGNIYELGKVLNLEDYDCIVIRGVLHHLPDPKEAIQRLAGYRGTIVVLEPNGCNPVLKLLERFSKYHIEHEERSFFAWTIEGWLKEAGFESRSTTYINLVPFFCPNWMARGLRALEPLIEKLPIFRTFICGQVLITARSSQPTLRS